MTANAVGDEISQHHAGQVEELHSAIASATDLLVGVFANVGRHSR